MTLQSFWCGNALDFTSCETCVSFVVLYGFLMVFSGHPRQFSIQYDLKMQEMA